MSGVVALAAGGTGGHLYPAEAVAGELMRRDFAVALLTDPRSGAFAERIRERLEGLRIYLLPSRPLAGGPAALARGIFALASGSLEARRILRALAPQAVIGFGGYPSLPTMFAAAFLGLPTLVHEQNAILGRANRLLAPRARRLALAFSETEGLRPKDRSRAVHTGNPVRPEILAFSGAAYNAPKIEGPIEVLVLGGSQGARVLSEVVPAAFSGLPSAMRGALKVSHQARREDLTGVIEDYRKGAIAAEVESFFEDVPLRLARAHLVICRAGASTIAELAAIGRPAVLIPYPFATDDHQGANARAFEKAGGGWVLDQSELDPERLKALFLDRISAPEALAKAAQNAARFGRREAAQRLAKLALDCMGAAREGRAA